MRTPKTMLIFHIDNPNDGEILKSILAKHEHAFDLYSLGFAKSFLSSQQVGDPWDMTNLLMENANNRWLFRPTLCRTQKRNTIVPKPLLHYCGSSDWQRTLPDF